MGCHTWCYRELPHSEDFKKKLMVCLNRGFDEMYDFYHNRTDEEWMHEFKCELDSRKDWLDGYDEATDKSEYRQWFNSDEEMLAYVEECRHFENTSLETYKNDYVKDFNVAYEDFVNMTDFYEFLKKYGASYASGYSGDITVFNDKLYIRTDAHFEGKNWLDNEYVFPANEMFGDMFRIGDYTAPNCFSYDETINVIKSWVENHSDENYRDGMDDLKSILEHDDNCVRDFFNKFPTGVIHFG